MDDPGKHAYDSADAYNSTASASPNPAARYGYGTDYGTPTSGAQQFWWVADSVPLGRQLVIGVLALALVGLGFGIGRLGQKVIVQQVSVPVMAPRDAALPTAGAPVYKSVVLDATMSNPQGAQFATPAYVQFQPRLPWLEYPAEVDPALLAIDRLNREVTALNIRSMADYVRRSRAVQSRLARPAAETYYVTRRTPAYARVAQLGDRPAHYLMPGTPLQLQRKQSRWAQVRGPGGEALWVKSAVLSLQKTHRSS